MPVQSYVETIPLAEISLPRGRRDVEAVTQDVPIEAMDAAVNANSILSFVSGLDGQEKFDVLYSIQFAQRAASAANDRFSETPAWYRKYIEVLELLGWAGEQFSFARSDESKTNVEMNKEVLTVIAAAATANQLTVLTKSIEALGNLADDDGTIDLFEFQSSNVLGGNFQVGVAEKGQSGLISIALGAFYFKATERKKKFLFFKWSTKQVNLFTAAQKMVFNPNLYAIHRETVQQRLADDASKVIAGIPLA